MGPGDWALLAEDIAKNYYHFDGKVDKRRSPILFGTMGTMLNNRYWFFYTNRLCGVDGDGHHGICRLGAVLHVPKSRYIRGKSWAPKTLQTITNSPIYPQENLLSWRAPKSLSGTSWISKKSYPALCLSYQLAIATIREPYNDARKNLIMAVIFASSDTVSEVSIFFHDRLIRGCRATKINTSKLLAFDRWVTKLFRGVVQSPFSNHCIIYLTYVALTVQIWILLPKLELTLRKMNTSFAHHPRVHFVYARQWTRDSLRFDSFLDLMMPWLSICSTPLGKPTWKGWFCNCMEREIYPAWRTTSSTVSRTLPNQESLWWSWHSVTLDQSLWWVCEIRWCFKCVNLAHPSERTHSCVVCVPSRRCLQGHYATGQALKKAGVVSAGDMTLEATATKLAYLLGRQDLTIHEIRELMAVDLRGELTPEDEMPPPPLASTFQKAIFKKNRSRMFWDGPSRRVSTKNKGHSSKLVGVMFEIAECFVWRRRFI